MFEGGYQERLHALVHVPSIFGVFLRFFFWFFEEGCIPGVMQQCFKEINMGFPPPRRFFRRRNVSEKNRTSPCMARFISCFPLPAYCTDEKKNPSGREGYCRGLRNNGLDLGGESTSTRTTTSYAAACITQQSFILRPIDVTAVCQDTDCTCHLSFECWVCSVGGPAFLLDLLFGPPAKYKKQSFS